MKNKKKTILQKDYFLTIDIDDKEKERLQNIVNGNSLSMKNIENEIAKYSLNGGKINEKVQILLQKSFQNLRLKNYWILDKYDGVNKIFKNDDFYILYEETKPLNSDKTIKFVFDILKANGKNVSKQSYEKRMSIDIPKEFVKKPFCKIDNKDSLLFRLYDNKTDTIMYGDYIIPIDGLILQNDNESFKIKKPYLNTIDFRMIYDTGKIYLETLNSDGKTFDRFFNPFFDNNVCYLNEEPNFTDDISERIRNDISNGYKYIVANANSMHEKFGEFSNINGHWYFLRMRDHPNSTQNAIKISSLIYSPLHTKEGYFNKVDNKETIISIFSIYC